MLQQETPRDFVVSTGVQHSVRQFVEAEFHVVGMSLECVRHPFTSSTAHETHLYARTQRKALRFGSQVAWSIR